MARVIDEKFPEVTVEGHEHAGIAHANTRPYIVEAYGVCKRKSKSHGRNRIEGKLKGDTVVDVEDLHLTGGSSIEVVQRL